MSGDAPAFLVQPLWQGSGAGFKAPAWVDGQQGNVPMHNPSAGVVKITGISCCVLSPALSPEKGWDSHR